jgi:serine protease Do
MVPLDAASSIVLLEFERSYGLGFVAPNGRIVTCLHVVSDEAEITAHLADGRSLPVKAVCGVDARRDLAVLDVGLLDAKPVKRPAERFATDGTRVFAFGMVPNEGRARWVEATLAELQVLGSTLTVYRVEGDVPNDSSGGPLVSADGTTLGVVTVAETDDGLVTLGVPWKYVEPLLGRNQELPLTSLSLSERKAPRREVPNHPLSVLEGSTMSGLEASTEAIAVAIREGAPAYNAGDVAHCYRVYSETARRLIDARRDCPGVQKVLREGLARAESLRDLEAQAWAMRDAFDGLLAVIDRFMRTQNAARASRKSTLLN